MKARTSVAEMLAITNNIEKMVLAAGTAGIKAGEVTRKIRDETGIASSAANRIVNNLLKAKLVINVSGTKTNKWLVHRDAETIQAKAEAGREARRQHEAQVAAAAEEKKAITDLMVRFDPKRNSLAFTIKNVRITFEVAE